MAPEFQLTKAENSGALILGKDWDSRIKFDSHIAPGEGSVFMGGSQTLISSDKRSKWKKQTRHETPKVKGAGPRSNRKRAADVRQSLRHRLELNSRHLQSPDLLSMIYQGIPWTNKQIGEADIKVYTVDQLPVDTLLMLGIPADWNSADIFEVLEISAAAGLRIGFPGTAHILSGLQSWFPGGLVGGDDRTLAGVQEAP
jgi:hypothetical protein